MNHIWTLARMTLREALRRRIILTGLLLGVCFLIVYSLGFHFIYASAMAEEAAHAEDPSSQALARIAETEGVNTLMLAGLYATAFLSIAMAALLAADTLAGEIESGTIQTLVTKPIRRSYVVLGKWLGFALLLGAYLLLTAGGTVLSVYLQSGHLPRHLFAGLGLMYMEALLIMTITLACSSALSALATGGVVFGLYGLAFIGGWIEQFGALLQNATAVRIGIVASLIIPSETLWRRAAYEMQTPLTSVLEMSPFATFSVPSTLMIVYTAVYLLGMLWLAVRVFQKRDM